MTNLSVLAIIWAAVLMSSYLARHTKLTPPLYFLAAGALMVNTGVLPLVSSPFIEGFSEVGIVLIMFALGFEENPGKFVRGIKRSWGIALFGAIGPFAVAYWVALFFWHDNRLAIMCALAMTATAVSLTMVSLRSEGLHTTSAARGIMTSAVLDDVASLALVAIVVPIATGDTDVSIHQVLAVFGKALLFFMIISLLGLWVFPHQVSGKFISRIPLIRNYSMRDLLMLGADGQATLTILLVAVVIGLVAHHFGFHPAIGAYMAGLILRKEYFHTDTAKNDKIFYQSKKIIDNVAFSWIGPVFFVNLGTKLVFVPEIVISVIPGTIAMFLGVFVVQVIFAGLAARYTGHFAWHEAVMIGFGMLGRAELAFVVLDIGYVQNQIFTAEAFYTLMFTAFGLNIAVPLGIKLWRPFYEGEKKLKIGIGRFSVVLSRTQIHRIR